MLISPQTRNESSGLLAAAMDGAILTDDPADLVLAIRLRRKRQLARPDMQALLLRKSACEVMSRLSAPRKRVGAA
jgi:hypothetical protein